LIVLEEFEGLFPPMENIDKKLAKLFEE